MLFSDVRIFLAQCLLDSLHKSAGSQTKNTEKIGAMKDKRLLETPGGRLRYHRRLIQRKNTGKFHLFY